MLSLQGRLSFRRAAWLHGLLHERFSGEARENRVSRGQNVLRGVDVRMIRVPAGEAVKRLAFPVFLVRIAAPVAGPAGVPRIDEDELSAAPLQLVGQLAGELRPSLVEDGPVQPGLLLHVRTGRLDRSRCAAAHVLHSQIFQHEGGMVLRQAMAQLVQKVLALPGDLRAVAREPRSRFGETVRHGQAHALGNWPGDAHRLLLRLDLPGAAALVAAQPVQRLLVGVERRDETAVGRGEEVPDSPVAGAHRCRHRPGLIHPLGLDRDVPAQGVAGDGEVPGRAGQVPAVAVAEPAELGQPDPAVWFVHGEALHVRLGEG